MDEAHTHWATMLDDTELELLQAYSDLVDARQKVAALTAIKAGLRGLLGLDVAPDPVRPRDTVMRPADAIRTVMAENPGVAFQPMDLVRLIQERGLYDETLKSGANAYTTALPRLADDGKSHIYRSEDGRHYEFIAPELREVRDAFAGQVTQP